MIRQAEEEGEGDDDDDDEYDDDDEEEEEEDESSFMSNSCREILNFSKASPNSSRRS